jgi:hypothetical protein
MACVQAIADQPPPVDHSSITNQKERIMPTITLFKVTYKPATNTRSAKMLVQRMDLNDKAEAMSLDYTAKSITRQAIVDYAKKRGPQYWVPTNEDDLQYIGDEKKGNVQYYITSK